MRRVVVVATGGTIASQKNAAGTATAGISGHDLVAAISLPLGVTVEVEQLFLLNSFNLSIADMEVPARCLQTILSDPGVHGFVVTHGTDTMEETAFLQSLFLDSDRPIVFTGAQRTPEQSESDGLRNLHDAITVAADEACRDLGAIIVFDGTVWPAAKTRKTRTLATAAFDSDSGPLGVIDQGAVTVLRKPTPYSRFDLGQFAPVRVDIVQSYPGVDAAALDAVVKAGTAGLIVEGMGVGNVGQVLAASVVTLLKRGMPVILTSRVPAGLVAGTYGDGGGADLVAAGAILGGRYRSPQLRILMAVAPGSSRSTQTALASLTNFLPAR